MKYPNNQWPVKGQVAATQRTAQLSHHNVKRSRRHDLVTMAANTSLSSSDSSYHSNSDEPPQPYHHHLETEDSNYSNGMTSITTTKRSVIKHDQQLARRPLHTYTPAGAGSVSVNATAPGGIKATQSYPPS